MSPARNLMLTVLLSLLAAALGAWAGSQYVLNHARRPPSLHQTLHKQLHLSADQAQRMEGLERDYAARRSALEAEMHAADLELAQAYREDHAYTPKVEAAVDHFHRAMDELQKESVRHVIAMRRLLTPDQTQRFDDTVTRSLAADRS